MNFRKAGPQDVDAVAGIYDEIHTEEEAGRTMTGWIRNVYPVRKTAEDAVNRGDLYVEEAGGRVVAAAIINRVQVDCYAGASWKGTGDVLVLHTLVVSPAAARSGLGKAFVGFYEQAAREQGITDLRMDTNARNLRARAMYEKLGFEEIGIVPCDFNGIPGVQLVLLEKILES